MVPPLPSHNVNDILVVYFNFVKDRKKVRERRERRRDSEIDREGE